MALLRLINVSKADIAKALLLLCIIVSINMLLVFNQRMRERIETHSIRLLLKSDIFNKMEHEASHSFVLLPQSKLQEYMRKINQNHISALDSLRSDHKIPMVVHRNVSKIRVVPKPNLSEMINASQTITTINTPYRLENPLLCSSVPDLEVLIIVHTSCGNFERRMSIRSTWANSTNYKEYSIRVLFLVGMTAMTANEIQQRIKNEFDNYKDLLVGDFIDSYHNLTLKGVMAYKWLSERCRNAKMILKVDDDIAVNMFRFFTDVYSKYADKPRHIICNYIESGSMPILRERKSKWYVSEKHFRGFSEYPTDYCSGFLVVMTNDLMPSLYASAKITPFFWVDDVYLYGLVPGNVPGVQYVGLGRYWHMLGGQDALRCYRNATQTCPYLALGAGAKGEPEDLWHEILKRQELLSD